MNLENFECEVCCEEYDETGPHVPLVLPCGHTFCQECLSSLHTPVCPSCKHPLCAKEATCATFPRNLWLIRFLTENKLSSKNSIQKEYSSKNNSSVPKVAVGGQRVLFKQLDKACRRAMSNDQPASAEVTEVQRRLQQERHEERLFLLNLSRICKEKKSQDISFNQKRFITHGLVSKFGDAKAKVIMQEVYGRVRLLRERRGSPQVAV